MRSSGDKERARIAVVKSTREAVRKSASFTT
jgi:hypothetical protein